nr:MAG TPA: phosphoadenosine-phosphosulfate reductase [Caudoviricetes sp.]
MTNNRLLCWFSCGAASAVATHTAIEINKKKHRFDEVVVAYTEVREEHPDNKRFLKDCEKWFGVPITVLRNEKYDGSIVNTFEKCRYMAGIAGAPCTRLLKKEVRKSFEKPTDTQVFGYTIEEKRRLDRFIDANNNVKIWAPLIDFGLTKAECLEILERADIALPAMYKLGYQNNNCIGCVKGGWVIGIKYGLTFQTCFKNVLSSRDD